MNRRDAIKGLSAATAYSVLRPLRARAQQARPVLGFLGSGSRSSISVSVNGFLAGLKEEAGYVDGQNLTIEYRWADGHYDRLASLAAELASRPLGVLFAAQGNVSALAAKRATSTIPIVFVTSDDPVATGLVASFNHPAGNLTGVSRLGTQLGAKNLELLHELVPKGSVIGMLANPRRPTAAAQIKSVRDAASALGKTVRVLSASNEAEIEVAFKTAASEHIGGMLVPFDSVFNIRRHQVVALAARYAIPTAYSVRDFVSAGGLMSYGDDPAESYKLGGKLAARILRGGQSERPACGASDQARVGP